MDEKLLNRKSLTALFSEGNRPNAQNFQSLIDSSINKVDDRISKNIRDGFVLFSEIDKDKPQRLLSFKKNIESLVPLYSFVMDDAPKEGVSLVENSSETDGDSRMYFQKGGNIGVHNTAPKATLHVNGSLGMDTQIGTHKMGGVKADGEWHDVLTNLNGINAFQVVAKVGKEKSGKYALLHATALSTFGRSHHRIRRTQASYSWWWFNRLAIRWRGSTYDYKLQIRTRSNYGKGVMINFHVTSLWNSEVQSLFDSDTN